MKITGLVRRKHLKLPCIKWIITHHGIFGSSPRRIKAVNGKTALKEEKMVR